MCQSQQERGPCILVERLVVVSKMNFVNIFTGKLLSAREFLARCRLLAQMRSADRIKQRLTLETKRKTSAQREYFAF